MLTYQHKQIILATVPLLRESGVALTKHFYTRMFTHHPELKNLFNMGNQNSGKQQTALAMAVLAYAENIANPVVLMPVVDMIGHKHTSLNIQPEQYDIVGTHLLASIKEVLQDAATNEVLEAWALAYNQLANLMIGHEQKIYESKKEKAGNWLGWRTFIVKSKVEESAEITSFYLKPKDGKVLPNHLAGQYLSIKIFLPEMNFEQIRQYSISCAPNDEYFRISVKREKGTNIAVNGMISNYLHDYIFEGNELELSAPTGNFVLQETKNKKIFISGGIGQTPLLSMLETLDLNEKVQHDVVWIHACRNKEVHAFADKIKLIQNNHPNVSKYQFYDYMEESIADSSVLKGHIDFKKIEDWKFDKDSEYYVCGPRPFIKKMIEELEINQVNEEQIFFEEFGPKSL
ncbi:NO-inducible flavohemoprotein [Empedobacter falsenii]|uniref:NO-inducible flavohemoprotein n=1 Tax=Empedobacter falsenii TaxID=343874 RepID=UPI002576122C|nr:NO-inducible flavohemoprotein [Empedobacter falsenii]MDM1299987.1 NO-inducible flavohemoprotein [Empedobacter falsenii]MDM1319780.1 NO-inducible flavohemoprotein [Empedobacter falsenii]